MKLIIDKDKWKKLTRKITNAQILLERLKSAVKIGRKNIKKLREERETLEEKR